MPTSPKNVKKAYPEVLFRLLRAGAKQPVRGSQGAACFDIFLPDWNDESDQMLVTAFPTPFHTGISIAVPEGYDAEVRGRSGLATKGVLVFPGTIDSDYRGELIVLAYTTGQTLHTFKAGDRIAQLKITQIADLPWREVDQLPDSERGGSGFGSTGR